MSISNSGRKVVIPAIPPKYICPVAFGFRDYTSFFRAFKKEFGVAPREFKEAYSLHISSVPETRGRLPGAPNPPKK